MESSSLQNGNGRGKSYKEEERVVLTSPSRPPSAPKRVARTPKCPRCVSPLENRRKRANLPHQRKLAAGRMVSPLGASEQTVGKITSYRPAVSRSRQAVSNSGTWLTLGLRLAGGLFHLAVALCRQALPVDIFLLLLAISGHSLVWIFGTKLPIYKKDTKNGD